MSIYRSSSIKRQEKRKECFINGVRVCRECKGPIKPPKRTICSSECLHLWKIKSDNKYLRSHIYERDLGICALCSTDTRYTKIEIENKARDVKRGEITEDELLEYLKSLRITLKESQKSLWHADHIIPVKDGGGEANLDNIRTLCISCHKGITAAWRKSKKPKTGRRRGK
jgi:5-methylcytosine-specific restriction protein A